jgi:hypothetical protein
VFGCASQSRLGVFGCASHAFARLGRANEICSALGSLGVSNLNLDFWSRVLWFDRIDFNTSPTRNTRVA